MNENNDTDQLLVDESYTENLQNDEINDPIDIKNIPLTSWKYEGCCCFVKTMKIEKTNRYYCGYWEISACMPTSVVILILFAYFSYLFITFPRLSFISKIVSFLQITLMMILFFWSYFSAMLSDPGYLPYNWVETRRTKYSPEEIMSGTITSQDQYRFAKQNMPPSCSLSKTTGRFIIRADHICDWVTNWIGKRNHKQFILMNFYGALFAISLFVWRFFMDSVPDQAKDAIQVFLMIISASEEFIFAFILSWSMILNLIDLCENNTTITKYKQIDTPKYSVIDTMRQVCGNGSIISWLCPTDAFGDNIEL